MKDEFRMMGKRYRSIITCMLLLLFLGVLISCPGRSGKIPGLQGEKGKVIWVIDGDTVIVEMNGKKEKVRMTGIDTPEFGEKGKKPEYYSREAFQFTMKLKWQTVLLVQDPLTGDRDKYGRLLRYVIDENGDNFNAELVRKGYASVYRHFEFTLKDEFMTLEMEAKRSGIGRWRRK